MINTGLAQSLWSILARETRYLLLFTRIRFLLPGEVRRLITNLIRRGTYFEKIYRGGAEI